jgi:hypothetical protein
MDPLTIFVIGGGALLFREMNRKDHGVLTPSREERYQNMIEYCYDPAILNEESKLFAEYGLKVQAKMLKRRAEWRSRTPEVKQAHEDIYQRALKSVNIPAILEVADAFEGWTATKKASILRDRVRILQEEALSASVAKKADEIDDSSSTISKHQKGNGDAEKVIDVQPMTIGDK